MSGAFSELTVGFVFYRCPNDPVDHTALLNYAMMVLAVSYNHMEVELWPSEIFTAPI